MLITLKVTKTTDNTKTPTEMDFPVGAIALQDWTDSDGKTATPNRCKVFFQGVMYQAHSSRKDIKQAILNTGMKIVTL